jgi:hypothetical protein
MWRTLMPACLLALAGCATGPLLENPLPLRYGKITSGGPVYLPQGAQAYARVFEHVYDILQDYWDIAYANRYDGRIETQPRIAPGIEQPWKPGSPDCWQRLLAFTQTIRHRCIVRITAANDGGYFVDVKVLKELEDLPTPARSTAGEATYRVTPTVERQYEIIEPQLFEYTWIPIGRDHKLEQVILERIASMDLSCPPPAPSEVPAVTP